MRRSLRRKQEAAASADAANTTADTTAQSDQKASTSAGPAAAGSAVAAPGPKFLSLGLSPFYQMDNSGFNFCKTTDKLLKMCYEKGEGFYPCKTLAAAKAKYGAGLHDGKYEDAAVEYRQAYLCHSRGKAAGMGLRLRQVEGLGGSRSALLTVNCKHNRTLMQAAVVGSKCASQLGTGWIPGYSWRAIGHCCALFKRQDQQDCAALQP